MPYKPLAVSISILFGVLCLALIFLPQVIYWLFSLQGNSLGDFLAKRAGILFFSLSILCFHSRNTRSVEVQRLVSLAIGVAMGGMALLGVIEFFRGAVSVGIFAAVTIEVILALLCFAHLQRAPEQI